jgi:hypothetical protein
LFLIKNNPYICNKIQYVSKKTKNNKMENTIETPAQSLADFFNHQHEIMVCTANAKGEPNISIMGTPRLNEDNNVEFEISDPVSVTLQNIQENKEIVFMAFVPAQRARDYGGARIQAEVLEICTSGEKIDQIRNGIREKHGEEKAAELIATVTCTIKKVRPIVDRGQKWNEPPFAN